MPRYYIDTDDDVFSLRDEEGQQFADIGAACDMACRALPEMAKQRLRDRDRRTFTAAVRDERGAILYVATLSFAGGWSGAPSAA